MKGARNCKDYQAGDEEQILALNNKFNDRQMSLKHWQWKFAQNPFGQAMIKLMYDGGKLVGHRGAIPMAVSIRGRATPAAIMVNTLTHPDYRRLGISTYLAEAIYTEARQRGVKFIYNFPNPNSYPLYLQLDAWEVLDQRSAWEKELPAKSASERSQVSAVRAVTKFDQRVNQLWERVKDDYVVVVPRTEDFLNWRFIRHPSEEYAKFIIEDGEAVSGYLILKVYTGENEVKGHIVDMLCVKDGGIVKAFLSFAYNFFVARGIKNLSCWLPESSWCLPVFAAEGFVRRSMETHFGLRILAEPDSLLQQVREIKNWHLTMGDSDVF